MGRRVYPSLEAIGQPIDLLFVAVPAPVVPAVVREAAACGVRSAVIISAGFGETGEAGQRAEAAIGAAARAVGMRLVGPNCFGIVNADPAVSLHGTFGIVRACPGRIALAAESGAIGIMALDEAAVMGYGLGRFISLGNRIDVSMRDVVVDWGKSPDVGVITLYLESITAPHRFIAAAREVSRVKPIIALKAGRTSAGARAAASHTAALVSSEEATRAVCDQAGIVRVETLRELLDVARLLEGTGPPRGARVGIVTNSGGPAILCADAAEARGLVVGELSRPLRERLATLAPPAAGLTNPIDLTAGCSPEQYGQALQECAVEVDMVVAVIVPIGLRALGDFIVAATDAVRAIPAETVCCLVVPSVDAPHRIAVGERGFISVFREPEAAARALAGAAEYARRRTEVVGEPHRLDGVSRAAVRSRIEAALGEASEAQLGWPELEPLLRCVGIPSEPVQVAALAAVTELAAERGYPLVAKIVSPGISHKTDVGGVVLNIESPAQLAQVVEGFVARAREHRFELTGVALQRFIPAGREVFVGVSTEPAIGPVVACGLGGTAIEVLRDVACGIPPLDSATAERMIDRLRGRSLLGAFRGAAPVDRRAFVEVIVRVGALVEAAPELVELDINPLILSSSGAIAVDGRAVLRRSEGR